ncbi:MAG: CBS domain-containing protein [Desulfarculus sp.]|nr:CBS domain-containing protein [Desulfarculus sp.]
MKIKHWMTSNPITVKPGTPILEAAKLMRENQIRRLPVVDKDKVVGMLTHRNILEASPSAATTLSVHELNYLLSKLTVADVMRKDPICVNPEDSVLDVVLMGHEKGIGAFPVVDARGRLVGIATETEIYRAFVGLLGTKDQDSMITLENIDLSQRVGAMSRIASIIEGRGVPLLAMFSLPHRRSPGFHRLYIRVHTKDTAPLIQDLQAHGYTIGD